MENIRVLYEDNHLLAVIKPPGVPMQADASGARDLLNMAKDYVKDRYQKPGAVYLGMVHRLDRPVGGVAVFARTSKAAARLSRQIAERQWEKIYYAVTEGSPPEEGRAADWLVREEAARRTRVARREEPGAQEAELRWSVAARQGELSLLRVELVTGRHHQIRVQMASRGWPLWADARYGRPRANADIALWAASVSFAHPVAGYGMILSVPPPRSAPWNQLIH